MIPIRLSPHDPTTTRWRLRLLVGALALVLGGCAAIAQRAADRFSTNLGRAILNQDDPATVRDGLPAYLLLLDGMIEGDPRNAALLRAAAGLYGAYAGSFVSEPARAATLAARARDYARRATCIDRAGLCAALERPFPEFETALQREDDVPALFALAGAWATWIQAHSEGYEAIADIPRVEAILRRVVQLEPAHDRGMPWVYLGVLGSLRPEAVGGRPEQGRAAFERALEISQQRNLMAKTLFARHYARLVFDQELHDRLLREVLDAEPRAEGLTLSNVLAREQAELLLRTSPDYF
jgi:hypothetical protein